MDNLEYYNTFNIIKIWCRCPTLILNKSLHSLVSSTMDNKSKLVSRLVVVLLYLHSLERHLSVHLEALYGLL